MDKHVTVALSGYSVAGKSDFALMEWNGTVMTLYDAVETGENPSFLLQRDKTIYVAHELSHRVKITAWTMQNRHLVQQAMIELSGAGLCHLCDTGRFLVGSCWGSGDFFAVDYALQQMLWQIQVPGLATAHAHCSICIQDRLLCCDLGRDAIGCYAIDSQSPAMISCITLPAGTGPRQILPLEQGRFIVVGENSNSVLLFGSQEENNCLLDEFSLKDIGHGWPGGACMVGMDRLIVPIRGTKNLVQLKIVQCKFSVQTIYQMQADWVRMTMMQTSEFIFAAQQKQNFIEAVEMAGAVSKNVGIFPFSAPAFILKVIENEDDNHES